MDFGYASLGEVKCSRSRTGGVISKYVTSLVSPTGLKKIHELGCVFDLFVFFVELGVVFIGEDF